MPNGATHQAIGASVVFFTLACSERERTEKTLVPVVGAGLAGAFSKLPDIIEPADNPNHRQFFHSLAFAGLLGFFAHKIYRWSPTDEWEKALRFVLLMAISAYLIHLALDCGTPRSLPWAGKF